jgi:predicted nucleic acid-binding protein
MPVTEVVSDASVALKWFRDEDDELEESRRLVTMHRAGTISLSILGFTLFELGNALLRGRAHASVETTIEALDGVRLICPVLPTLQEDFREAARLANTHGLTFYDAAYAAVALRRGAYLATLDSRLLASGLGQRPSVIVGELGL